MGVKKTYNARKANEQSSTEILWEDGAGGVWTHDLWTRVIWHWAIAHLTAFCISPSVQGRLLIVVALRDLGEVADALVRVWILAFFKEHTSNALPWPVEVQNFEHGVAINLFLRGEKGMHCSILNSKHGEFLKIFGRAEIRTPVPLGVKRKCILTMRPPDTMHKIGLQHCF